MNETLIREAGFEVVGHIGSGSMGEVWRVRDPELNRVMALKVLRDDWMQDPAAVQRFMTEAQATAQLEHPGIVPVHALKQLSDGRPFFTMKEVKGRTLAEILAAQAPDDQPVTDLEPDSTTPTADGPRSSSAWSLRRLIGVLQRVCEAVSYAHARGVLHRDLKPSNIMVGDFGEVLVVDWGLVKIGDGPEPLVTARSGDSSLATRVGTVTGTPAYMPPEQARGLPLDPGADVYALGAILYEVLTGQPPYVGRSAMGVLAQVVSRAPLAPGARTTRLIPAELEEICLRSMARSPGDRYPEAGALASAIGAWMDGIRRREQALDMVGSAEPIQSKVAELRGQAEALQSKAEQLLDEVKPSAPVDEKAPGWVLEDEARQLEREADLQGLDYLQRLQGALTYAPDLPEAHAKLADHYRDEHMAAEARRDMRAATRFEVLLRAHDRGRYLPYLRGDGLLTLYTDPPGAEITLFPYITQQRRLVLGAPRSLGQTPLLDHPLAMGSYLLELRASGRQTVFYPVYIERTLHWDGIPPGETAPMPVYLPREGELGPDDCYVPAGWFWSGGDARAHGALPRRKLWLDPFVIRRFPVTSDEYLLFLNDLVDRGREEEALIYAPRERAGTEGGLGPLICGRDPDGHFYFRIDADGDPWNGDEAITMVDWNCARAYAGWEATRTRQAWRLPHELEWEKAARGVDGRYYPWGDFADPTWACVLDSHPERPRMPAVDSYPIDQSPYGVRGMAGNVREWCLEPFWRAGPKVEGSRFLTEPRESGHGPPGAQVVKGASWLGLLRSLRVATRAGVAISHRVSHTGFRIVRPLEPRSESGG